MYAIQLRTSVGIVENPELKEKIENSVNTLRNKIIGFEKDLKPKYIDSPIPSDKKDDTQRL